MNTQRQMHPTRGDSFAHRFDSDTHWLTCNEGRNDPVCDADSVIGCTAIATCMFTIIFTAPDWWPVIARVFK